MFSQVPMFGAALFKTHNNNYFFVIWNSENNEEYLFLQQRKLNVNKYMAKVNKEHGKVL